MSASLGYWSGGESLKVKALRTDSREPGGFRSEFEIHQVPLVVAEYGRRADQREGARVVRVAPPFRGIAEAVPEDPADPLEIVAKGLDLPDSAVGIEPEGDGLAQCVQG